MSLKTFSSFYYGHTVTSENNLLDFTEGIVQYTAEIDPGIYSLTEFAIKVANALNTEGTLTYVVSIDRDTRKLTVSANGNFELNVQTGPSTGTSVFPLMGFTGSDRTGGALYEGDSESGSEYRPQFILQDHVPSTNFKRTVQASVNEAASGEIEVVRFGSVRFVQFNITMITDKVQDGRVIRNNPNGLQDANDFMDYVTNAGPIEFMADVSDRSTYQTLRIESTPQSRDGIDYQLKELYGRGMFDYYETGQLVFRVID